MKVKLAGDSVWKPNVDSVDVWWILQEDDIVTVGHSGPWQIYTDSGFRKWVSGELGEEVTWTEQGAQNNQLAHLTTGVW